MDLSKKVDPEVFLGWLRKGLGRAVLYVRRPEPAPYNDAILHACLHHLAYDKQCERTREQYLFDLIQATGEPLRWRDRLIDTLGNPDPENDLWQVIAILAIFRRHGDGF